MRAIVNKVRLSVRKCDAYDSWQRKQCLTLQFGIWTAYPAALTVFVSVMSIPSALALSMRRMFFVSNSRIAAAVVHANQ